MKHIEFIGSSGAGKTSIYSNLVNDEIFYNGYDNSGVYRIVAPQIDINCKFSPHYFNTIIKKTIWKFFSGIIYCRFAKQHPEYNSYVEDLDQKQLVEMLKQTAARFQLSYDTIEHPEVLCMDEGFYQRAISISVRKSPIKKPPNEYFDNIPTPDIIVRVSPTYNTINDRRLNNGLSYSVPTHNRSRELINSICEEANNRGTRVIRIQNDGKLSDSVNQVKEKLTHLI